MSPSTTEQIVSTCRAIDVMAQQAYSLFSAKATSPSLQTFWARMASEEAEHVLFWDQVLAAASQISLSRAFVDPDTTLLELNRIKARAQTLLKSCGEVCEVDQTFLIAFRMEFYLLHPAFEYLFHAFQPLVSEPNPADAYDDHVNRFLEEFNRHKDVTPAMELLGETLQSLWYENRRLARLVHVDPLTGVLNRRGFQINASQLAYLAQRTQQAVGILMVDIDDFKQVNDTFGHDAGDHALRVVADRIRAGVRTSDAVGRYGGEEFVVLLSALEPGSTAAIAEKIRSLIEASPVDEVPVTVSIGCVEGKPEHQIEAFLDRAVQAADTAMYAAKKAGKNLVKEAHLK